MIFGNNLFQFVLSALTNFEIDISFCNLLPTTFHIIFLNLFFLVENIFSDDFVIFKVVLKQDMKKKPGMSRIIEGHCWGWM